MNKFGIGQSVLRFEDPRLLRGQGRYVHDVDLPGQAHAVLLRSPHAHARLRTVDVSPAGAAPGVRGVFTEADLAADGLGTTAPTLPLRRADGAPLFAPVHPGLARGRVRHVGDPIALIVADTLAAAKDAAERVEIDYEPLPALAGIVEAAAQGAPALWADCPDNAAYRFEAGSKAAADAAFARAARVVRRRYVISRVYAQYLETRGAVGRFDPADGRFTLYVDVQYPHRVRNVLATRIFHVPEHRLRVVAGDVGGAFGSKGWQYPEHRLVLWAARKLGRPVKWVCERSEAILADEHARDNISEADLALDGEARFLALRVRTLANLGAYVSSDRNLLATIQNIGGLVGVYDFPAAHVSVTGVLTNTNPTAPYRGAGRPEATFVIERLIDDAARELGADRIELRRRNLIRANAFPYKTALTFTYDCGAFEGNLDRALALSDFRRFPARRDEARRRGKLRGIGIANAIERAASPGLEFAEIRFDAGGSATVLMGTKNQGQGHETTFKQIVCERLGLAPEDVRFVDGDTDRVAFGTGTMGSRSTVIGGSALWAAAEKLIAKGRNIAAHLLEAGADDIRFADGRFTVAGTDRSLHLRDVAIAAFQPDKLPPGMEPGFYETGTFSPAQQTFPNSCHVCEVEIDRETGAVEIVKYVVVDDVGTVINPLTLKGQIHGGVVQGLGQVLMEQVAYDRASGQLLSGSLMDYALPRADSVCAFEVASNPVPTKLNPLGAKGAGEAGTVGALAAGMNAIIDALAPLGVRHLDMPATSEKIWRAIAAQGKAAAAPGPD
jgi:carbon-monoxide dehydrogenase large subunit